MGPKKKKEAALGKDAASSKHKSHRDHSASKKKKDPACILSSRSTATSSQRARALELLKISPQTTYSFRKKGISHPAQRLKELMNDGHIIVKSSVNAVDSDGYLHVGVAMYSLLEPSQYSLDLECV